MASTIDKKCPACGTRNAHDIEESFSHFDDVFYFEYFCDLCKVFWRRKFKFVELQVRKDDNWEGRNKRWNKKT